MPLIRVTITLPPDLVQLADRLARQSGASRSSVLAAALRAHLDAQADGSASHPGRVAEPRGEKYRANQPAALAAATDDTLLAELARRLGAGGTKAAASRLTYDRSALTEICRRYGIQRLAFFGSALRDDFGADSDVDVLVAFEPGHTPGLAMQNIEDELSVLFGGRRVDLVTAQSLHPLIRDRVLADAVVQYAA